MTNDIVYEDGFVTHNGDDAIELFEGGYQIDVFGDINQDGTGTAWEYKDVWAYKADDGQWIVAEQGDIFPLTTSVLSA